MIHHYKLKSLSASGCTSEQHVHLTLGTINKGLRAYVAVKSSYTNINIEPRLSLKLFDAFFGETYFPRCY